MYIYENTLFLVAPTAVKIVDPGEGGGLVVGRRYDITCRAWGSRPPASLTWYLGVTRLGREYTVPGTWESPGWVRSTQYLVPGAADRQPASPGTWESPG
jgi:hypothetical protein